MKLQLKDWQVTDMTFSLFSENGDIVERDDKKFSLDLEPLFLNGESKSFAIVFKIKVEHKLYDLSINAIFNFLSEDEITDEFKKSSFPKVNAPAIAFPYLRAYISNLTLQSGYSPVILPSINFINLNKKKEEEGSN